jgi:ankyrin repeat protein
VQADVDKQIILNFSDDRHLLYIVNCLKKYRITTLILSLTKYAVQQLVEIVRASDRLRTLVYCNQFPYYDNELNSSISFRGITTLAIHIDHKKMLDAFPDVTRLEIRGDFDKHLVNLDKAYLKVKELLVTSQVSHEIDSLKKKFPNLTHLALLVPEYLDYSSDLTHSLSQQWQISYSIISSREKTLSYKDFFSLYGSSKFFHLMSCSNFEDALADYFTHSSFEYECDLYSRAHEFSFPIGIDFYSSKSVDARSILPTNSCLGLPPMNRNFIEVLPALHWPYWINLTANAIYGSYEQALQILKQFNGERQFLEYGGPILLCELASKFQISQIIHYLGLDILRALTKLRDRDGATFLHLMNFYKQKVNIQDLAEYIEDWNPRDNNGNTPLFRAFRARKLDHVQFLYCKGALLGSNGVMFEDILLTCNRDFNIMKPFLRTIRVDWNKLYVHSLFRIANFDILLEDSEGRSLLTLCTRSENDALTIIENFQVDINHIDTSGRTVLTAILERDASPNTLLERGANPNVFGTELGTSPLMLAVDTAARDEDRAKRSLLLLLAKKADINAVIDGANATQTALSYAVQRHFKAIVKLLIARGADMNFIDNQGNNLLHHLCNNPSPKGAALVPLLADKVQINHKNNLGRTPLQYAIQNNVPWALELIKHGAK